MRSFPRILSVVCFAVYPVLSVYVGNIGFLQEGGVLVPVLVVVAISLLIFWVNLLIFKKHNNSVFVSIFIMMWLQLYGHVYYGLMDFFELPYEVLKHRYFIFIYSAVFGVIIFVFSKRNDVSIKLVKVAGVISVFLCAQFVLPMYKQISIENEMRNKLPLNALNTGLPDVYYIVTDSYSNEENLQEFYSYDNSQFLGALENLGFDVQDKAQSNYPYTYLSLASSLNMEYVNHFEDSLKLDKYGDDFPFKKIYKNKVADYFQSKGYQYVLYKSAYSQLNNERNADVYVDNSLSFNQFHQAVLELSVFSVVDAHFLHDSKVYHHCLKAFENLNLAEETEGSKFVFFHCLPPHPPLVFNADGSFNSYQKNVKNRYREKEDYTDQVSYVNSSILMAVKNILEAVDKKPIIIIQGDHGTCSEEVYEDELKWNRVPSQSLIRERYGILNAVYSPPGYKILFEKGHTPVNSFKVVFNKLFNDSMLLDSNHYYFSNYRAPYDFQSFKLTEEEIKWGEGSRN